MAANVIHLPRPRSQRPVPEGLGFYVRAGRNDHVALLDVIATGDTHCCPHGTQDMLSHPARHAIYQRAREIERLSAVPQNIRAGHHPNQSVRKVSDDVAQVAAFLIGDDTLAKGLQGKQREMSRFRQTIAHLVESDESASVAVTPPRRQARKGE